MLIKRVNILSKDYRKIRDIFSTSIPSYEHISLFSMYILSLRKDIHYLAFYEDKQIIGVMYTIETDKLDYLLYLAVNPELRSKGYGSKMIEWLKNRSGEKPVALDVEKVEESAPNYAQRQKRLAFYERNGFYSTNYNAYYNDQYYTILTNKDNFHIEDLIKLFKTFSFNLYRPEIKKITTD